MAAYKSFSLFKIEEVARKNPKNFLKQKVLF